MPEPQSNEKFVDDNAVGFCELGNAMHTFADIQDFKRAVEILLTQDGAPAGKCENCGSPAEYQTWLADGRIEFERFGCQSLRYRREPGRLVEFHWSPLCSPLCKGR